MEVNMLHCVLIYTLNAHDVVLRLDLHQTEWVFVMQYMNN